MTDLDASDALRDKHNSVAGQSNVMGFWLLAGIDQKISMFFLKSEFLVDLGPDGIILLDVKDCRGQQPVRFLVIVDILDLEAGDLGVAFPELPDPDRVENIHQNQICAGL